MSDFLPQPHNPLAHVRPDSAEPGKPAQRGMQKAGAPMQAEKIILEKQMDEQYL